MAIPPWYHYIGGLFVLPCTFYAAMYLESKLGIDYRAPPKELGAEFKAGPPPGPDDYSYFSGFVDDSTDTSDNNENSVNIEGIYDMSDDNKSNISQPVETEPSSLSANNTLDTVDPSVLETESSSLSANNTLDTVDPSVLETESSSLSANNTPDTVDTPVLQTKKEVESSTTDVSQTESNSPGNSPKRDMPVEFLLTKPRIQTPTVLEEKKFSIAVEVLQAPLPSLPPTGPANSTVTVLLTVLAIALGSTLGYCEYSDWKNKKK